MNQAITFKGIHRIAVPAIVAGIAEPVLSLTDTAIVGNIPETGTVSLAAVGIVGSFLSMLIWILGQTRSSVSTVVSQYFGAGRINQLEGLLGQTLFFNVLLSVVILISTLFFVKPIFTLFESSSIILESSILYYKIRIWGLPLTLVTFVIFGAFRGLQNTFWPMIIATTGATLNIVLDYILVYGISGVIPALNIEGAAYASVCSQLVMALMALYFLFKKTNFSIQFSPQIHPELKRIISMSLHLFVRSIALNAAIMFAVYKATSFGEASIGAHTIAINIWLFAAFFIDGYGAAANSIGGLLLGSKSYSELWQLTKKVLCYGILTGVLLSICMLLFYDFVGTIFSKDPEVLSAFNAIFIFVIITQPINATAFILDGLFKGLGEMQYLRNVLLVATFLVFIPVVMGTTAIGMKLQGIWIGFILWTLIRGVLLGIKFKLKFDPLRQKT